MLFGLARFDEFQESYKVSVVWFWLVLVTLVLTMGSAFVCHRLAIRQQGDLVFWGVLGMLIGPIAIPITALLAGREFRKKDNFQT